MRHRNTKKLLTLTVRVSFFSLFIITIAPVVVTRPVSGYGQNSREITLTKTWKISERDNPAFSNRQISDEDWDTIELPGHWNNLIKEGEHRTATVWLRNSFTVPSGSLSEQYIILYLGKIAIIDEVYVNGNFIGATGIIPSKKDILRYPLKWWITRKYSIPVNLIIPGETNTIAIRVFSHAFTGINIRPRLISYEEWNGSLLKREFLVDMLTNSPLIVNIILLLIFLILMVNTKNRWLMFYLSLAIALIWINGLQTMGYPLVENGLLRLKMFLTLYLLAYMANVLFVQKYLHRERWWQPVTLVLFSMGVSAVILAAPDTAFLVSVSWNVFIGAMLSFTVYFWLIYIIAIIRDPIRFWFHSIFILFFGIWFVHDLYYIYTFQMYRMDFTVLLALPTVMLLFLLAYIRDLKKDSSELDSLSNSLMRKNRQLKALLEQSRRNGMKPEPRHIIQNVIDYLNDNYSETYNRKELAARFGLNEVYMGELFKKVTGSSISSYINCRRIEVAKQLIEETGSKIIDIAFHVGFDNLTYFYRFFKKKTGHAPNEYRKIMKSRIFTWEDFLDE